MDRVDHFGRDLFVALDRATAGRCASSSRSSCATACAGRLHAGTALPATRARPSSGVARGVVVEAYGQLVAEGFLVARRGWPRAWRRSRPRCGARGRAGRPHSVGPLRPASGVRVARRVSARPVAGRDAPRARGCARCRPGLRLVGRRPRLRAVLAACLGRARGVVAPPDDIVVTAGITQAIALLAGLLRARGARRVLVEEPGFWQHRTILQRAGLELVPVEVDDDGLRTDALPRPRRPRSSPPRTSSPPAVSSLRSAARRSSPGPTRTTPS